MRICLDDKMIEKSKIFALMHEIPLENAGGGVLLREILRHLSQNYSITAIFPVNSYQNDVYDKLIHELEQEGIVALGMPLRSDWGRLSFTLARFFSVLPGCVCAMDSVAAKKCIAALTSDYQPECWLLISPFAACYLPEYVRPDQVRLYYTNVDEDIMAPSHGTVRQRVEGWFEKYKVRLYVFRTAGLAKKRAAITANNANVLTRKTGREVSYVPPLMAPRVLDRSVVQVGLALITTNYTYSHNRISMEWFFREVWPIVNQDVRLEVTGLDTPDGDLRRLCEQFPRVAYLGFLSKVELEKAFQRCAVVINPTISGSGFQIKMLDAMARGVPVVSTEFANPLGQSVPCSDDPKQFAHIIHNTALKSGHFVISYDKFHHTAIEAWKDWLS